MGRHFRVNDAAASPEVGGAVSFSIGVESGSMSPRFFRQVPEKKYGGRSLGSSAILRAFLKGVAGKEVFF
jgi:hypothetical protein